MSIFKKEEKFIRILYLLYIYKPNITEPTRNVSVVADEAPANPYRGIRNKFNAISSGRRMKENVIATRGEPLPMTTVDNTLSITEKEIPTINMLNGMIAPEKFSEYKIVITSFALELNTKIRGKRPRSIYRKVW